MTAPNSAPSAHAGPDQQVLLTGANLAVILNGSRSRDGDGSIVSYRWRQVSGAQATIDTPNLVQTTVRGLAVGDYRFELTVTDNRGAGDRDIVAVRVSAPANRAPIAHAGSDRQLVLSAANATTVLDGTMSSDPDGGALQFAWTQVAGPSSTVITAPSAAQTTAQLSNAGVYEFALTVTDDRGASARDTVLVTVTSEATPCGPVAVAGREILLTLPANSVVLDGSRSSATNGSLIAWAWEQIGGPAAGCATGHDTPRLTLSGLVRGVYRFRLTVTDSNGRVASDETMVWCSRA